MSGEPELAGAAESLPRMDGFKRRGEFKGRGRGGWGGLVLSNLIRSAYLRNDFITAFIVGPQGIGKTTYAMLVAYEVYGDWDKVLQYLFFDPAKAIPHLRGALASGSRIPVIIFDDAGYHLSKYLMSRSRESWKMAQVINAFINLARTMVAAIIYTSPDLDVLKELRKKAWIVVEPKAPHGRAKPQRLAFIYQKRLTIMGRQIIKKIGIDAYDLRSIPPSVRKEYEQIRREALEPLIKELDEVLQSISPQSRDNGADGGTQ